MGEAAPPRRGWIYYPPIGLLNRPEVQLVGHILKFDFFCPPLGLG